MNRLTWRGHETFEEARRRIHRWERFLDALTWSPWTIPAMLVLAAALGAFVLRLWGVL